MTDAGSSTPYDQIGGETALRALVDHFYRYMNEMPEARPIRKMHSADLSGAKDKLFKFLSGWLGGPDLFMEEFGHPRLRMRHIHFPIGQDERDQWVACMRKALEETSMEENLREMIFQALAKTADHMMNR